MHNIKEKIQTFQLILQYAIKIIDHNTAQFKRVIYRILPEEIETYSCQMYQGGQDYLRVRLGGQLEEGKTRTDTRKLV